MPLRHARLTVWLKDTAREAYRLAYVDAVVLERLLDAHAPVHVHELGERHRGDVWGATQPRGPHATLLGMRLVGLLLVRLPLAPELVH